MNKIRRSPWIWYQEYRNCSCTFLARTRKELPGYCQRHVNNPRRTVKLPGDFFREMDMGFVET